LVDDRVCGGGGVSLLCLMRPSRAPEGTIALLFTDIEGSTRLARLGSGRGDVLAAHHRLLEEAIGAEDGFVDAVDGDAFFATFVSAAAAARALTGEVIETEPLGLHRLKDFPSPELLFCPVVDGRGAAAFPAPRTQQVRPTNLAAFRPRL
jgi:hypothetical protein